ncbi:4Fe-4S dicluster domain-containing protein, partial [bacterium]|nr:4Fe-4S dicluster domain-containing protein [bacterium]
NFRNRAGGRLRHRIFRKEVYLHDKYLRSTCVGCGRCNRACVAGINLVDIYNQVMGV